jgi:hypothetical protein
MTHYGTGNDELNRHTKKCFIVLVLWTDDVDAISTLVRLAEKPQNLV